MNDECRLGFVCVGGIGDYGYVEGTTVYQVGICKPTIILRQICLINSLRNGVIGQGLVAMAIIGIIGSFLFGKMDYKPVLYLGVGIALIFGSLQVMYLITGDRLETCDLIEAFDIKNLY